MGMTAITKEQYMLSKQAEDRLSSLIDQGFLAKCAQYGLDIRDSQDRMAIEDLMKYAFDQIQKGQIVV